MFCKARLGSARLIQTLLTHRRFLMLCRIFLLRLSVLCPLPSRRAPSLKQQQPGDNLSSPAPNLCSLWRRGKVLTLLIRSSLFLLNFNMMFLHRGGESYLKAFQPRNPETLSRAACCLGRAGLQHLREPVSWGSFVWDVASEWLHI